MHGQFCLETQRSPGVQRPDCGAAGAAREQLFAAVPGLQLVPSSARKDVSDQFSESVE